MAAMRLKVVVRLCVVVVATARWKKLELEVLYLQQHVLKEAMSAAAMHAEHAAAKQERLTALQSDAKMALGARFKRGEPGAEQPLKGNSPSAQAGGGGAASAADGKGKQVAGREASSAAGTSDDPSSSEAYRGVSSAFELLMNTIREAIVDLRLELKLDPTGMSSSPVVARSKKPIASSRKQSLSRTLHAVIEPHSSKQGAHQIGLMDT